MALGTPIENANARFQYNTESGATEIDQDAFRNLSPGQQMHFILLDKTTVSSNDFELPSLAEFVNTLSNQSTDEIDLTKVDTAFLLYTIIKQDNVDALSLILGNPIFPESNTSDEVVKNALRKAIQLGSAKALNYMIDQNVKVMSKDGVNTFSMIKSLIFKVFQSVETEDRDLSLAHKVWVYFARCFLRLHLSPTNSNQDDVEWSILEHNGGAERLRDRKDCKWFISNPVIQLAIFRRISSYSYATNPRRYLHKMRSVLHFLKAHYMVFDDKKSLKQLHEESIANRVIDCHQMKRFKAYRHSKEVTLFWTEYVTMSLIENYFNAHLLMEYHKTTKQKQSEIKQKQKCLNEEKEKTLDLIQYLIENGVGEHYDIIMEFVNDWTGSGGKFEFKTISMCGQHLERIRELTEYSGNVWKVKSMDQHELLDLFLSANYAQTPIPECVVSFF